MNKKGCFCGFFYSGLWCWLGNWQVVVFYFFGGDGYCIVGVQVFQVVYLQLEILVVGLVVQCVFQVLCGIFVEYQVLVVEFGEFLFVDLFYGGLYWCFQCVFDGIDQGGDWEGFVVVGVQQYLYLGYGVLVVWCCYDVFFGVQLFEYFFYVYGVFVFEVFVELFLNQLLGQCCGVWVGGGIGYFYC